MTNTDPKNTKSSHQENLSSYCNRPTFYRACVNCAKCAGVPVKSADEIHNGLYAKENRVVGASKDDIKNDEEKDGKKNGDEKGEDKKVALTGKVSELEGPLPTLKTGDDTIQVAPTVVPLQQADSVDPTTTAPQENHHGTPQILLDNPITEEMMQHSKQHAASQVADKQRELQTALHRGEIDEEKLKADGEFVQGHAVWGARFGPPIFIPRTPPTDIQNATGAKNDTPDTKNLKKEPEDGTSEGKKRPFSPDDLQNALKNLKPKKAEDDISPEVNNSPQVKSAESNLFDQLAKFRKKVDPEDDDGQGDDDGLFKD